jgi:hypothetical protein
MSFTSCKEKSADGAGIVASLLNFEEATTLDMWRKSL